MRRPIALAFTGLLVAITTHVPSADADAPAGRYAVANGTVRDVETGLVWSQTEQPGGPWSWVDAQDQCAAPWRVPTVQELRTLVDLTATTAPTIDTSIFYGPAAGTAPSSGWVWTSTPYMLPPTGYSFYVNFADGAVDPNDPTQPGSVRCVQ
ncbi:MAG TPA: DUF1566 domain-containing protein [Polyangiaceae bacterium]|jgi:hypothetical protein|nr:DUF1566 domain-containing protein [Polyangiaceae bacterium]